MAWSFSRGWKKKRYLFFEGGSCNSELVRNPTLFTISFLFESLYGHTGVRIVLVALTFRDASGQHHPDGPNGKFVEKAGLKS